MTIVLFCKVCGSALAQGGDTCPACGHIQRMKTRETPAGQAPRADEMQPGSWLEQRYRIQKKIGAGGFGLVYKAWDKQWRRTVAIKQITLAALSAREMIEATDSYNREITLLPRLHHRNLPELYEHFTDSDHWYIVMQYINGQTLEEMLAKNARGRLPVGEVIALGAMLCDVLGYLHVQDPPIVFRDVKPANIMYSRGEGQVYLIDFGIARRYREGQGKDTKPLGSPGYAAPEQYGKSQSTPRTDVYGLGATLQTLLTGKEPWEIQAEGTPPGCEIPTELQTLLSRMMEPDPEQRPALMWSIGTSLRELQKRYPRLPPAALHPLAWLRVVWILLMLAVAPFFFWNVFHQILLAAAVCLVILRAFYLFYKARKSSAEKLNEKKVRAIARQALTSSGPWIGQIWAWNIGFIIQFLFYHFDTATLITLIIYVVVSTFGVFWISRKKAVSIQQVTRFLPRRHLEPPIQESLPEQEIRIRQRPRR